MGTKYVWPLVNENPNLMVYFPDLKESQLPEKEFMYGILGTLMPYELREMIAQSMKSRSPLGQEDKNDLIEVSNELKDAIENLYEMKSKFQWSLNVEI